MIADEGCWERGCACHDSRVDGPGIELVRKREWIGLTEAELQFQLAKHRRLVNAHYDKGVDTNIITETFDSTSFYNEVVAILKEKNAN